MADDNFISIEVDEDAVMFGLDHQAFTTRRFLKDLVNDVAETGVHSLEGYVPRNTKESTGYLWRHIDRTSVYWLPGGAGGGGTYEAIVGIKAGTSEHPFYVRGGTGLYGPKKKPYGPVRANRMYFFSHVYGRVIGISLVRGQKPNPFLEETYVDMRLALHQNMMEGQLRFH